MELPSKIFYSKLNFSDEELKQHEDKCKSYNLINTDSEIIKICAKLVKYLTNYNEQNNGDLKDHHCNLLSLWIIEQLFEKFERKSGKVAVPYNHLRFIINDVIKEFTQSEFDNCLRYVPVSQYVIWKKRKDLYDYCVDYDKFNKLDDFSDKKCQEYEEYINEISPLYNQIETLYIPEYKTMNKDFYEKCR
ncbi:hypothetical protein PCYB_002460, partial [Plasmodium cynomolgi strain B]